MSTTTITKSYAAACQGSSPTDLLDKLERLKAATLECKFRANDCYNKSLDVRSLQPTRNALIHIWVTLKEAAGDSEHSLLQKRITDIGRALVALTWVLDLNRGSDLTRIQQAWLVAKVYIPQTDPTETTPHYELLLTHPSDPIAVSYPTFPNISKLLPPPTMKIARGDSPSEAFETLSRYWNKLCPVILTNMDALILGKIRASLDVHLEETTNSKLHTSHLTNCRELGTTFSKLLDTIAKTQTLFQNTIASWERICQTEPYAGKELIANLQEKIQPHKEQLERLVHLGYTVSVLFRVYQDRVACYETEIKALSAILPEAESA